MHRALVFALAGVVLWAQAAQAQFVGGVAPAGAPYQVFAVPDVAHTGNLASVFTCTNASDVTVNVAVQVFDRNGAQMNASPALAIPPGGTAQFATALLEPFSADQDLSPVGPFAKGSAKIWSSSRSLLLCGAVSASTYGGTFSMRNLTIVSKLKQKGD